MERIPRVQLFQEENAEYLSGFDKGEEALTIFQGAKKAKKAILEDLFCA